MQRWVSSENWKGFKPWLKFLPHLLVPSFQGLCCSNCLPIPAGRQTIWSYFAFRVSPVPRPLHQGLVRERGKERGGGVESLSAATSFSKCTVCHGTKKGSENYFLLLSRVQEVDAMPYSRYSSSYSSSPFRLAWHCWGLQQYHCCHRRGVLYLFAIFSVALSSQEGEEGGKNCFPPWVPVNGWGCSRKEDCVCFGILDNNVGFFSHLTWILASSPTTGYLLNPFVGNQKILCCQGPFFLFFPTFERDLWIKDLHINKS